MIPVSGRSDPGTRHIEVLGVTSGADPAPILQIDAHVVARGHGEMAGDADLVGDHDGAEARREGDTPVIGIAPGAL